MKICSKCGVAESLPEDCWCRPCRAAYNRARRAAFSPEKLEEERVRSREWKRANPDVAKRWNKASPERRAWIAKRGQCRRGGIPFDLPFEFFLQVPEVCEVLGITLEKGSDHLADNCPELDRKKPALGYVLGNVRWISRRANRLRQDATFDEARKVWEDALRVHGL